MRAGHRPLPARPGRHRGADRGGFGRLRGHADPGGPGRGRSRRRVDPPDPPRDGRGRPGADLPSWPSWRACPIGSRSLPGRRRPWSPEADVVTNSGHVRPIDAETVAWMKPTAVVPLMYEAWELAARRRGPSGLPPPGHPSRGHQRAAPGGRGFRLPGLASAEGPTSSRPRSHRRARPGDLRQRVRPLCGRHLASQRYGRVPCFPQRGGRSGRLGRGRDRRDACRQRGPTGRPGWTAARGSSANYGAMSIGLGSRVPGARYTSRSRGTWA